MAIEIKELYIKVDVKERRRPATVEEEGQLSRLSKREIVEECFEKVMEHLERKFDR